MSARDGEGMVVKPALSQDAAAGTSDGMARPTADQAAHAVSRAREMFGRALACWASDLLTLRRRGRHVPTWRPQPQAEAWSKAA